MGSKRVVITGMGAITSIGKTLNLFKESLYKGVSGCDLIKSFDTSKFKTKFACEVKNFNPKGLNALFEVIINLLKSCFKVSVK